jgi:hypothetical protein
MKRTDAKHFNVNTEVNTGEQKPNEYCSVHPQKFCSVIKCSDCKHLYEYVDDAKWLCIACVDHNRDEYEILPFHSSGNCDACKRQSVARALVERKQHES